ncbi:hypothetical protein FCR2A7T_05540 [Flavobacterium cauense R2A-7]|uniref:Uncharacterized protein n=1 Tax=Flavobacterium cauense R2A-7 TaxID=1341154 RepID=V6S3Z1_9FLAO|nr:hypothetical protein [Flavobacterium cauense]ESU21381.1 hypothetical protein FCR2A7T_05540 [Flavobacterium cauense R2A-7]KGO79195.1 hypothetical protein Q762_14600 [Flavobacterium cauense R2A-7]TWI07901.1 hypothetical protein IP98_02937 [Flavobacterium cauense R2A-7]
MIEELIANYDGFHDALVLNFEYKTNIDLSNDTFKTGINEINLIISCFNLLKDYKRETIKISFTEIDNFKYIKYDGMISDSLIKKENDFTVIDFDPEFLSKDENGKFILGINPNSELQIKFKNLFYEIIE